MRMAHRIVFGLVPPRGVNRTVSTGQESLAHRSFDKSDRLDGRYVALECSAHSR
jgi:hypothetical protein